MDNFKGKHSLATTRMFLFDIVEQMFVRNMPELANYLRDQLREACDRESMQELPGKSLKTLKKLQALTGLTA